MRDLLEEAADLLDHFYLRVDPLKHGMARGRASALSDRIREALKGPEKSCENCGTESSACDFCKRSEGFEDYWKPKEEGA